MKLANDQGLVATGVFEVADAAAIEIVITTSQNAPGLWQPTRSRMQSGSQIKWLGATALMLANGLEIRVCGLAIKRCEIGAPLLRSAFACTREGLQEACVVPLEIERGDASVLVFRSGDQLPAMADCSVGDYPNAAAQRCFIPPDISLSLK